MGGARSSFVGSKVPELEEIEYMESLYMKTTVAALRALKEIRSGSSKMSVFSLPPLRNTGLDERCKNIPVVKQAAKWHLVQQRSEYVPLTMACPCLLPVRLLGLLGCFLLLGLAKITQRTHPPTPGDGGSSAGEMGPRVRKAGCFSPSWSRSRHRREESAVPLDVPTLRDRRSSASPPPPSLPSLSPAREVSPHCSPEEPDLLNVCTDR
ncbi:hypothetical protein ZIOFF_045533 [Zingiber officinale]|uniref:Uncharacterized protein n=1 Tax=Zingiber officinale TaxID=94328 RepID=A0A8J5G7W4_ZINOF|nr:hypothetical protein ZIOFF_045533 [Zingiber officinale]